MEVNIQATMGICSEFMQDDLSDKREVAIVIAPLKVTTSEDGNKLQIISGCNLWRSCFNGKCWYSIAARQTKK